MLTVGARLTRRSLIAVVLVELLACGSSPQVAPPARRSPPPPPAQEEPALKPGLSSGQLRQTMKDKADPAVRGCYTVAYSGKQGGTGRLVVDFTVDPDGSVSSAEISGSTLDDPTFEDCVRKVYEALVFPKAPGSTDASRPYNFRNGQDEADAASAAQ